MRFITRDTQAYANFDYQFSKIEVRLFRHIGCQPTIRQVGQPVAFSEEITTGRAGEPTFRLDPEGAQQLMDSLWDCGVRPTGGEGNTGQLGATQKHLEDFRALVFAQMEVAKP